MISVLLADDSEVIRRAIAQHLNRDSRIRLVGQAGNLSEAIRLAKELHPAIVLLDLHMRDDNGVDAMSATDDLVATGAKIIAISIFAGEETAALAAQVGAAALLDKTNLVKELIPAILQINGQACTAPA